jgi:hypothetical protein
MNLSSITKALSVPCALIRYNRRYQTNLSEPELIILYIMHQHKFPLNKSRIITKLSKLQRCCSYNQLNKRINNLIDHILVDKKQGTNKFSISPEGKYFLSTIELWSRTYRIDKIKY